MIKVLSAEWIDPNIIIHRRDLNGYIPKPEAALIKFDISNLGYAIISNDSNDSWIVKMLLSGGADPNSIVSTENKTAVLQAISIKHLALVKVLLAAGDDANPILQSGVKLTPLQSAAKEGMTDIVITLLDNGADINAPPFDRYGATALQFAAMGGYVGTAPLLIQRGADVNAPPAKIGGRTALEGAAENGRIDMLQLLLSSGALIIDTGLAQHNRARELALEHGHRAACRLLEKYRAEVCETLALWGEMTADLGSLGEDTLRY